MTSAYGMIQAFAMHRYHFARYPIDMAISDPTFWVRVMSRMQTGREKYLSAYDTHDTINNRRIVPTTNLQIEQAWNTRHVSSDSAPCYSTCTNATVSRPPNGDVIRGARFAAQWEQVMPKRRSTLDPSHLSPPTLPILKQQAIHKDVKVNCD